MLSPEYRPVIGLVMGDLPCENPCREPMIYRQNLCVTAIRRAGGLPVNFPLLNEMGTTESEALLREYSDLVEGLLLPGGPDIDPNAYDEIPRWAENVSPALDYMDRGLVRHLLDDDERKRPILGICRGAQLLNVEYGGSLWQDLDTDRPAEGEIIDHVNAGKDLPDRLHPIAISTESILGRHLSADTVEAGLPAAAGRINIMGDSLHHQAINRVGPGLEAVAWAPDGTIEAIEDEASLVMGTQWHLETEYHKYEKVFKWFVQAAANSRRLLIPEVVAV